MAPKGLACNLVVSSTSTTAFPLECCSSCSIWVLQASPPSSSFYFLPPLLGTGQPSERAKVPKLQLWQGKEPGCSHYVQKRQKLGGGMGQKRGAACVAKGSRAACVVCSLRAGGTVCAARRGRRHIRPPTWWGRATHTTNRPLSVAHTACSPQLTGSLAAPS